MSRSRFLVGGLVLLVALVGVLLFRTNVRVLNHAVSELYKGNSQPFSSITAEALSTQTIERIARRLALYNTTNDARLVRLRITGSGEFWARYETSDEFGDVLNFSFRFGVRNPTVLSIDGLSLEIPGRPPKS